MATEIVSPATPLELLDAIQDRLLKAIAIVDYMGVPTTEPVADATPGIAGMAAKDLMREAQAHTSQLFQLVQTGAP